MLPHHKHAAFARAESGAVTIDLAVLGAGLIVLALSLFYSIASGVELAARDTRAAMQKIMVTPGFDDSLCPIGWEQDHASALGTSETEIRAWYLDDNFHTDDEQVLENVLTYLQYPQDFRHTEGRRLTQTQIYLCIAEARRLI